MLTMLTEHALNATHKTKKTCIKWEDAIVLIITDNFIDNMLFFN